MIFKRKDKNEQKVKITKQKIDKPKKPAKGIFKIFVKIGHFFKKVFGPIGGYFKGSWQELKQVRWPNRAATWGLTGAVILFTAVFTVIIILLDAGFDTLFNLILE